MAKKSVTTKKTCKCKTVIGRILLVTAGVCAATVTVMKVIDKIKSNKANAANPTRDFKEFFNFFGAKNVKITDSNVAGIISKNLFGATELDLSEASFKEDGFISLEAKFSAINIIIPKNVNVKIDGLIKASAVNNDTEENTELPTLYIASKLSCTALNVSYAE